MYKKRFKIFIYLLIFTILVLIGSITLLVLEKKNNDELAQSLTDAQTELASNQQDVYVATKDIRAGDKIYDSDMAGRKNISLDQVNIEKTSIYSGQDSSIYLADSAVGGTALVDIAMGAPIQAKAISEEDIDQDTRSYEVSVVNLTTTQKTNDIVDIRILFPDGTDYIVLSKKTLLDLRGTTFDLHLNEDEILRLDSATVDAATLGARLYTTKYVEANLQSEAVPFYPVKQSTIDLIYSDPNIISIAKDTVSTQVRQSLEDRIMNIKMASGDDSLTSDFKSEISVSGGSGSASDASDDSTDGPDSSSDTTTETEAVIEG